MAAIDGSDLLARKSISLVSPIREYCALPGAVLVSGSPDTPPQEHP